LLRGREKETRGTWSLAWLLRKRKALGGDGVEILNQVPAALELVTAKIRELQGIRSMYYCARARISGATGLYEVLKGLFRPYA
jgi:hypothetical protein